MGKISQQIKIFIWAIFFCILEGGLVVAQLAKVGTFPDNCVFEMRNKIQGFLSTEFE